MRYIYLELENYIGIYNGMGLNNIKIDMSTCMYKTLIIRGENGSGKSTLFKAMSFFPDRNEAFIPGLPAKKIISILDHDIIYTATFIHGVNGNGEREVTKAFISKNIGGTVVELNENGNVKSFKDIVSEVLSLDPNFIALSQLSTDDKGLATKRPGDRKQFVNSIVESLEVYNDIYKVISKKATAIKTLIDSTTTKLANIGSIEFHQSSLAAIEDHIKIAEANIAENNEAILKCRANILAIDPDGSIQDKQSKTSYDMSIAETKYKQFIQEYRKTFFNLEYELQGAINELEHTKELLAADKENQRLLQSSVVQANEFISDIMTQIKAKSIKLESMTSENFSTILERYNQLGERLSRYKEEFDHYCIDPEKFDGNSLLKTLEIIDTIQANVDKFRGMYSLDVIQQVTDMYLGNDTKAIPRISISSLNAELDRLREEYHTINTTLIATLEDMESIKVLDDRPAECKIDTCPFISKYVNLSGLDLEGKVRELESTLRELESNIEYIKHSISEGYNINEAVNSLRNIAVYVDANKKYLINLPRGEIFSDTKSFLRGIYAGNVSEYFKTIHLNIDLANDVEEYHNIKKIYEELKIKVESSKDKKNSIDELRAEIEYLTSRKLKYISEVDTNKALLFDIQRRIDGAAYAIPTMEKNIARVTEAVDLMHTIKSCREVLKSISNSIISINENLVKIGSLESENKGIEISLETHRANKDAEVFAIKQFQEYSSEIAILQDQYNHINIIKHYSSPTKGIQLVFMELYMGKILSLANELLALLFNGEYVLQPFIINESEFRIPCLGQGIINDDISSMSTSQLTMISMIISFALLHTSSSKYNILKLDEIDGPLDENNRLMFIDVINRIMDMMNVEQCVMVSHSNELEVDRADVILLKSSKLSLDYERGNIIWKY